MMRENEQAASKIDRAWIQQQLYDLQDESYRSFASKLIPNIDNLLGVRLPLLRKLAKQIVKHDWRAYWKEASAVKEEWFEETMLQGMVIGYLKEDIDTILNLTQQFVPKVNNWSVCDTFCSGLKIARQHQDKVWSFIQPYLVSKQEYELRFAIVMLLSYYVNERYLDDVLSILNRIQHEGYYVKMAVAWAVSVCYVHFPERTMGWLAQCALDDFTYNKSLQKITESLRVDDEAKTQIRAMKRR